MEAEFRNLVNGNNNFNGVTLESFSALPEGDVGIFFDTSSIAGTVFKGNVMALRNRFKSQQGRGNITDNFYDPAFAENFVNSIADVMALSVELPRTNSTSSSASSVHGQYGPPVLTFRLRTNEEREAYRAERQACALRGQGGNQCRLT